MEDEQSITGGRRLAVGRNGKMGDGQFGTWRHAVDTGRVSSYFLVFVNYSYVQCPD